MTTARIVHVIGTASQEGTGILRLVDALAGGAEARGLETEYWFLGGPGALLERRLGGGQRAVALEWDGTRYDPLGVLRFAAQLVRRRPGLVCQHSGGRLVRRLAGLMGARVVLHVHGYVWESQGTDPVAIPGGGADAHAIIANSRATAEHAGLGERARIIYPGTEVADRRPYRAAGGADDRFVLGTAGRLVPVKGIDLLIEATARLSNTFPRLRLEIAGSGPERSSLEALVRDAGLEGRVAFLGWCDDLAPILARWDLFCLPSRAEGFGLAALEAMAAGLPVIASDVGGLAELIDHERNGWLVPAGVPGALADAVDEVLRDPVRRHAVGEAGRQRVSTAFSAARMVDATLDVYAEVLGSAAE